MDYKCDQTPQLFLQNRAKWHKTCHLKFNPSKHLRAMEQWDKKCQLTFSVQQSRGVQNGEQYVKNPVFFGHSVGKLHKCLTVGLDHGLREMAVYLQDTSLLARISGGDLIAIEGKYSLSDYTNHHRSHYEHMAAV